MQPESDSAAISAMGKLEEFYNSLDQAEKLVVSEMVRDALLQAAGEFAGETTQNVAAQVPPFVQGMRPNVAPTLARSLNLPGMIVAYSPGCASRGLLEIVKASDQQGS